MSNRIRIVVLLAALGAFSLCAALPWHDHAPLRRAVGIVAGVLILWIAEVAPLGIVALGIPVAAVFSGVLSWDAAIARWGDKVLFLFLGAFLLARALDKHGAFDWVHGAPLGRADAGREPAPRPGPLGVGRLALIVLLLAGAVSLFQNNTAVTAMLLPAVTLLSQRTRAAALPLLALSYGATLGGMAAPVGTAPNFIGYSAIRKLDESYTFLTWMRVGVPIWLGATLLAWAMLTLAARRARADAGAARTGEAGVAVGPPGSAIPGAGAGAESAAARRWAIAAFACTAAIWLISGSIRSLVTPDGPVDAWIKRYLPEELVPIAAAWLLFMVRVGPRRRPVLDRHDFQALDWDTLFLIAGGLTLGSLLEVSGAATALAAGVAGLDLPPTVVLFALAGVTVLLSELTSNTATAALLVPIAASVAPAVGLPPVHAIMLVALCASLGFALPISTPPNALVYGTRLVPLRTMAALGLLLDAVCVTWVVLCVRWLA